MHSRTPSGEHPVLRVRLDSGDRIARITLANPNKRNALSPETVRQLRAALDAAVREPTTRVVVLAAEGPDFCAGADLAALADLVHASPEVHRADAQAFADLLLAIRGCPRPVIAAVQGRALAGGAGLASACDIVVAAESAAFGYPEVRIGFVAAVVMAVLRSIVGEKAAFDLLITGRQVTAAEARAIGLVTRTVPDAELDRAVLELAGEIAALPDAAVVATKKLFHDLTEEQLTAALHKGVEANVAARGTAEFRGGLSRFLTRRDRR